MLIQSEQGRRIIAEWVWISQAAYCEQIKAENIFKLVFKTKYKHSKVQVVLNTSVFFGGGQLCGGGDGGV